MTCPLCSSGMTEQALSTHVGTTVVIDVCLACQVFWFDARESLRLSPGATLTLFRLIGESAARPRAARGTSGTCPRCRMRLVLTHDLQRATRFEYLRCPRDHGRLTSFFDFLREKDFIRPLTPDQIEALRRQVSAVHCSNCGASIDLTRTSTCAHCGSALSMLDLRGADGLIATLRDAGRGDRPIDPTLPLQLERARREVTAAFDAFEHDATWTSDVRTLGLVGAGFNVLSKWLK